jgi:hypothetical protein
VGRAGRLRPRCHPLQVGGAAHDDRSSALPVK